MSLPVDGHDPAVSGQTLLTDHWTLVTSEEEAYLEGFILHTKDVCL